jgi:RNA polymerase sporulation-specific sigma factor
MYFRSRKKTAGDLSLSESIDTDVEGNSLSLIDVIYIEDDMLDSISMEENSRRLRKSITETLTDREKEIITLRYGLNDGPPKTQREIADMCGISRSYVSQRA